MTDPTGTTPPSADDAHDASEEGGHPRGTLLLMLLFLIMIVAMWGYIYMMMIGRG